VPKNADEISPPQTTRTAGLPNIQQAIKQQEQSSQVTPRSSNASRDAAIRKSCNYAMNDDASPFESVYMIDFSTGKFDVNREMNPEILQKKYYKRKSEWIDYKDKLNAFKPLFVHDDREPALPPFRTGPGKIYQLASRTPYQGGRSIKESVGH